MEYINREITQQLTEKIKPGKVLIIAGARRVGKTFILKELIKNYKEPSLFLNGEDLNTHTLLARRSARELGSLQVQRSSL